MSGRKIIGNAIFYSLGEIIPRILAFLLLPILTSYLTTAEYGINSYITAIMTFVFVVASLSLNTYVLKQYFLEDGEENRRKLIGGIFLFICIFNLLLVVIQVLIIPRALEAFHIKIPFYPYFFLGILNNFFDVISIIPLVVYRVKGSAKGFFYLSVSRIVLQYAAIYILVAFFKMGLLGTFYGRLVVNIFYIAVYLVVIYRNGIIKFSRSLMKDALTFSLPLLPGSLSYLIITLSDRIILERYVSLNDMGIYSVAFTLALALNVVVQALYKTLEPILLREYHRKGFERLNVRLFRYYLLLIFTGGFTIALLGKEVFQLAISKSFFAGYKIISIMTVSVIISGVNVYLNTLLIAATRHKIISVATVISAVISIVVNILLISKIGYTGAAIAAILASCTANVISHANIKMQHRLIIPQVILLLLVAGMPFLMDYLLPGTMLIWGAIFIKVIIILAFAGIAFLLLGCQLKEDMHVLGIIKGQDKSV
ncbi:MAG TPA: oligosaccharide flippase family protein [Chitinophagaceae bacterium]|nr:oligosaccharide flippase family protein [Chitinophagaceae bacterium]